MFLRLFVVAAVMGSVAAWADAEKKGKPPSRAVIDECREMGLEVALTYFCIDPKTRQLYLPKSSRLRID